MKYIGKLKLLSSNEISKNSPVSIGFECLDRDLYDPNKCYELLGKSGVKYARCQTGWAKCEKEKGIYNFTWLESVVQNLADRGIMTWFNVSYGNPLYMKNVPNPTAVGCVPLYYGDNCMDAWKRYINELAQRFKGKVAYYEIWNEPDIDDFWYPAKPDGEQYAKLFNITSSIIKSVIPNAKIGGCISRFNYSFLKNFFEHVEMNNIDFYCYHDYGTVPEKNYKNKVEIFKQILKDNGLSHIKLWHGESGYPSWIPKGHWLDLKGSPTERQQAIWLLRRFFLDLDVESERTSIFQIADMWEKTYEKATTSINKPAAFGILNGLTYTPKIAYNAISHIATLFNGKIEKSEHIILGYYDGDALESLALQCFALKKNDQPFYAYYIPSYIETMPNFNKNFELRIGLEHKIENPIIIDTLTGEVFKADEYCLHHGMICYKNLPIAEYPFILCDRSLYEIKYYK